MSTPSFHCSAVAAAEPVCSLAFFLQVHYVADSETEQVEWFSALEGAVAKIVRAVAGLEEEDSTPAVDTRSSSSGRDRDWANQLEKGFASVSKGSSSRPDGNAMVNIVGYSGATAPPAARRQESYAADTGNYGGTISYGQIDGRHLGLSNHVKWGQACIPAAVYQNAMAANLHLVILSLLHDCCLLAAMTVLLSVYAIKTWLHATALQPTSMFLHAPCRQLPYMDVYTSAQWGSSMVIRHPASVQVLLVLSGMSLAATPPVCRFLTPHTPRYNPSLQSRQLAATTSIPAPLNRTITAMTKHPFTSSLRCTSSHSHRLSPTSTNNSKASRIRSIRGLSCSMVRALMDSSLHRRLLAIR